MESKKNLKGWRCNFVKGVAVDSEYLLLIVDIHWM